MNISRVSVKYSISRSSKQVPFPRAGVGSIVGHTIWSIKSYADIADAIGNPKAVRAIGQANRRNALPIFIPCHRVIGKDRSLTGYAGSKTDMKAVLLELEGIPFVQK